MKLLVILVLFCVSTFSQEFVEDIDSEFDDLPSNDTEPMLRLPTDLVYHFYCKRHPSNGIKVRINTVDQLRHTDFSAKKDTLFLLHGWKNDNESNVNYQIRKTILKHHDINVIVVDWSKMAGWNYLSARNSVVRVGRYVAEFIYKLKELFGLQLDNVKFVGYSLGAHVAGNAGAALGGKVDRIVGLDPAGPLFTVANIDNRLDSTDARFVQVIHTSTTMGFGVPMGHADYFPNGGSSQHGCGLDLLGTCAHARAYAYYAESLTSRNFIAMRCKSYRDYQNGRCPHTHHTDFSSMGGFNVDYEAKGTYYLFTNSEPPYARG